MTRDTKNGNGEDSQCPSPLFIISTLPADALHTLKHHKIHLRLLATRRNKCPEWGWGAGALSAYVKADKVFVSMIMLPYFSQHPHNGRNLHGTWNYRSPL